MCGIAGEIRWDKNTVDGSAIERMLDQMVPRGPDGAGMVVRGGIGFGHRRLKIIDLSEHAEQPMVDAELGLTLAFNGCIYNYRELRSELETAGYRFFSSSDTEVILKAWHHWGHQAVERFNGMFAFAMWERDSGCVTIVRDRLGIKPCYLAEPSSKVLRFASSLHALVAAGDIDTSVNPVALNYYMQFHAVVPAPHTLLTGVRKLPPASMLQIDRDGNRKQWTYWQPSYGPRADEQNLSAEDWRDRVLASLRQAVQRRLVADVPVGVLLSGGLDSSLIVGLLAEAGQQVETFSIGFDSVGEEIGDEFQYSDLIVERFQTKHHQIRVDTATFLPNLQHCIGAMAEPMVSHDCIGFYLLSQEVSQHVTVVQSGQGADEIFAGYRWYPPMMAATDQTSAERIYAQEFCDRGHEEYLEAVTQPYRGDDHARQFIHQHFSQAKAERGIDLALHIDSNVMLVDDPVKRVDNMTMAASLEARVPFLDHELVELAARVPGDFKIAHDGKGVLKDAGRLVVPDGVIDRPKGYFPVPALKYLRGPYLDLVRDTVTNEAARKRGLFNPTYIDRLFADPERQLTPLQGNKLWQIGLLEMWLQHHGL